MRVLGFVGKPQRGYSGLVNSETPTPPTPRFRKAPTPASHRVETIQIPGIFKVPGISKRLGGSLALPVQALWVFVVIVSVLVWNYDGLASDKKNAFVLKVEKPSKTSWASFRNGHLQQGIATSSLPPKLELLWKKEIPDGVVTASAIVGSYVYVPGLNGMLYCLDRKTGKELWKYRSIENPDPMEFAPGFKAAPTVTEDTVYLGDEDGLIHAVWRKNGKKKWIFKTDGEIAGGAAIVDGRLIVGSHDSFLYCIDAKNGKLVWKFQTQNRVNCSAGIADHYTFVAGCDAHVRVIDIKKGKEKSDIPLSSFLIASPAILGDMLYVGTQDSQVVALNWKTEKIVWIYHDPKREQPYHASSAVTDKYVIVAGHDKQLHCIDRKTGKRVWVFQTRAQIDSSPVVVGKRIFFGSNDHNIYAVSLASGKQIWKFVTKGYVSSSPAVGEGCLVIGCEGSKGMVYCFGKKEKK